MDIHILKKMSLSKINPESIALSSYDPKSEA